MTRLAFSLLFNLLQTFPISKWRIFGPDSSIEGLSIVFLKAKSCRSRKFCYQFVSSCKVTYFWREYLWQRIKALCKIGDERIMIKFSPSSHDKLFTLLCLRVWNLLISKVFLCFLSAIQSQNACVKHCFAGNKPCGLQFAYYIAIVYT